jgi:hypothetical protein
MRTRGSEEIAMSEFWTWTDYWDFREAAKKERRYFWRGQTKVFLEAIRRTSKKRDLVIPKGTHFWRAQTGHDVEDTIPCPYPEARMVPLRNRARAFQYCTLLQRAKRPCPRRVLG